MSFKLRIRGRDYFEPSTAANSANPLILSKQEAELPATAANDEIVLALRQNTISRLAGLADPLIEEAKPYPCLSEAEHIRARVYHHHHFGCSTCCAAGQGRGLRCAIGTGLWMAYQEKGSTP